ncbi:hypothetical protein [Vibrio proteolyticus]
MGIGIFLSNNNLAAGQIVVIDANGVVSVREQGAPLAPGELVISPDSDHSQSASANIQLVNPDTTSTDHC